MIVRFQVVVHLSFVQRRSRTTCRSTRRCAFFGWRRGRGWSGEGKKLQTYCYIWCLGSGVLSFCSTVLLVAHSVVDIVDPLIYRLVSVWLYWSIDRLIDWLLIEWLISGQLTDYWFIDWSLIQGPSPRCCHRQGCRADLFGLALRVHGRLALFSGWHFFIYW